MGVLLEFARGFLRKASHSTKIYQAIRMRPIQKWYCMLYTHFKQVMEMFISGPHLVPLKIDIGLILEMVSNKGEYGLIQYGWMRINAKLWLPFTFLQEMIICQPFSERGNSYVGKTCLRRNIFYPISLNLEVLGIYQEIFEQELKSLLVTSSHQASKSSVDDSRLQISEKKQLSSEQVIDLSILPPCQRTLMLHLIIVDYVARLWKSSGIALAYLSKHGTS